MELRDKMDAVVSKLWLFKAIAVLARSRPPSPVEAPSLSQHSLDASSYQGEEEEATEQVYVVPDEVFAGLVKPENVRPDDNTAFWEYQMFGEFRMAYHQKTAAHAGFRVHLTRKFIFGVLYDCGLEPVLEDLCALLAYAQLVNATNHTALWYQIGAVRKFTGAKRTEPVLNQRLQEVYKVLNKKDKDSLDNKTTDKVETTTEFKIETKTNYAIIEFHAVTVAVREDIGSFKVGILRHGNLQNIARVRVDSIDGSAKQGKRYQKVNQTVVFKENETEKFVTIRIINDEKWDPVEEFFLRLTLRHTF
ncbi:uncharacterized protein LOC103510842 [Diaphorina citri]|uniref:Uncharacterized protein LOC103510842 n=1 Tax=Diaphorina citri TaxID=121845 RepID=A0A1S4EDS8_DIACI|nr:uncharacterized protein LOC103510842 [Diaphorina citri]